MIVIKSQLSIMMKDMINSFAKEHERAINPELFEDMIEKSEIIIEQLEISSEITVKQRIETAVNKVISELIKI
jgi:hypothetical protein